MSIVFLNGRYLEESEAVISVNDAGFLYGEGIYETLRTHEGVLMNLDFHLERLKRSADLVGIPVSDSLKLAKWLQKTVDRNGFWKEKEIESRVRLMVSGGCHGFDETVQKPTVLIQVKPLVAVDKKLLRRGARVITHEMERFLPDAKSTHMLPALLARRAMRKSNAYEVLFVDKKGHVTEGSITNFFLVQGGKLITPSAHVLEGTTRRRIFDLAHQLNVKVIEKNLYLKDLYAADELFICNALRGIIPVVQVNDRKIGSGKPGGLTHCLMGAFEF